MTTEGLFKGSTMTLNNVNIIYPPEQQHQHNISNNVNIINQERSKTLRKMSSNIPPNNEDMSYSMRYYTDAMINNHNTNNIDNKYIKNDIVIKNNDKRKGLYNTKINKKADEVLSPFDEQEAWAKISEIMESFGSGILQVDDIDHNLEKNLNMDGKNLLNNCNEMITMKTTPLTIFLKESNLEHLEKNLVENGFDNIEFINGILEEVDLNSMNIPDAEKDKLLDSTKHLPIAQPLPVFNSNNNNNPTLSVDQWLESIDLSEYNEIFGRHLYKDMERVYRVWEIELQTVLEINKIGHRKRILHSVSNSRIPPLSSIDELNADLNTLKANIMELREDFMDKLPGEQGKHSIRANNTETILPTIVTTTNLTSSATASTATTASNTTTTPTTASNGVCTGVVRHSNKKNRPAPKPPVRVSSLEIRAPSELLLGLPSNLRTQWRHSANSLIGTSVKYDVYYLGSTVVKELRGTESTRKSIQKLKRGGDRISVSATTQYTQQHQTPRPPQPQQQEQQQQHPQAQQQQQQLQQQPIKKQPVCLAISHRGVEFIDIESKGTICEHEIRNINCACQDADDLSHFAYITKDSDMNTHYCHVFNVDSMDLATEIILTLGQAFEVAYQLALRDSSSQVPLRGLLIGDYKTNN